MIPESLGNDSIVLPRGVVCDKCNNYFSREVEGPFLTAPLVQSLRFDHAIPSKKGRIPSMPLYSPQVGRGEIRRDRKGAPSTIAFEASRLLDENVRDRKPFVTYTPMIPPSNTATSRFLAKVAIGYIAHRLLVGGKVTDAVVEDKHLDRIRDHARRGTDPDWPIKIRSIYSPGRVWHDTPEASQILTEVDLLEHDDDTFLVFALFGTELTISLIDPLIGGYERWLKVNDEASPLYPGSSAADLGWTSDPAGRYPGTGWSLPVA